MEGKLKEKQRDEAYRIYIADALQKISESLANFAGGSYMVTRYYDVIHPKPVEKRTAKEVIETIRAKLRGR